MKILTSILACLCLISCTKPEAKPEVVVVDGAVVKETSGSPGQIVGHPPVSIPQASPVVIEIPESDKLSFNADSPFEAVEIQAKKMGAPLFAAGDFIESVSLKCQKFEKGTPIEGQFEVIKLSYLQYASPALAALLADHLGGEVVSMRNDSTLCKASHDQFHLRFRKGDKSIDLNAGLVANSFNRHVEWMALFMIRSDIAQGLGMPVPEWSVAANEWNCGRSVLGIKVLPDPTLASSPCK